jgi:hypothetical protein
MVKLSSVKNSVSGQFEPGG